MSDVYDQALLHRTKLVTKCYCGKRKLEERRDDLRQRLDASKDSKDERLAAELLIVEEDLAEGLLHAWRDVRFEIELEKKMVIVQVNSFIAACEAHVPYTDASADSSLVAIPVKEGEKRLPASQSYPLNDDTDVARFDDFVLVLTRIPNTLSPNHGNKKTLNMYVPPRRVVEFDEKEHEIEDAQTLSRCFSYAYKVSRRWLEPKRHVPCPGHLRTVRSKTKVALPPAMKASLAKRCMPIDYDVSEELEKTSSGAHVRDFCQNHRDYCVRRSDARWTATQEVLAAQSGLERSEEHEQLVDRLLVVMSTSPVKKARDQAKETYKTVPWIRPKYRSINRSEEHPSAKAMRKHYPGTRTWDGVEVRWEDIPKDAVPDSYVCARCCNAFGKNHAVDDCPSKDHAGWVPVYQRPMPHGLFKNIQRLKWTDPVELLEKAKWVDAQQLPVISNDDYQEYMKTWAPATATC